MPREEVVITAAQIRRRVRELGAEIAAALSPAVPHVVIALKGGIFFGVDLIRAMGREVTLGFVTASSYGEGTESGGEVRLDLEGLGEVEGREVLLVEDIVDTGRTLAMLREALRVRRPASLRTCTLLDKPSRRKVPIEADHVGFRVGDIFLVGYGLDLAERGRTLPDIRSVPGAGGPEHGAEGKP